MLPDGVAPADSIPSFQDEPPTHCVIAYPAEVQRHDGSRPAAAARVAEHVDDRPGIDQPSGIDRNGPPAAHQWTAPLEFLHREVHALPPERCERALDPVAPDQTLEVAGLASRVSQQRSVRALRVRVHEIAAKREKVRLATLKPHAYRHPRLGARDAMPEKAGHAGKEAGSDAKVFEKVRLRLRAQATHSRLAASPPRLAELCTSWR